MVAIVQLFDISISFKILFVSNIFLCWSRFSFNCIHISNYFVFLAGNFIPSDGSVKGKEGVVYSKHGGFCLETQLYPDSVNQKTFPFDSVLRPGKIYDHRVTYKFLDF